MESTAREPTGEEAIQALALHVAGRIKAGLDQEVIVAELIATGLDRESATHLVREVSFAHSAAHRKARERGQSNMTKGALWFIGGSVVTLITLADGGYFVMAYGAIIGGAIQFLLGWRQSRA